MSISAAELHRPTKRCCESRVNESRNLTRSSMLGVLTPDHRLRRMAIH